MMMTSCSPCTKYKSSIDCISQILKNEGSRSLMKGVGISILRGVAGGGVLVGFDMFKASYLSWRTTND